LNGHGGNNDRLAVSETAAPDPDWWTANINPGIFSDDIRVHHDCQITSASVSAETSEVYEVGMDSMSAVFQPADNSPFGYSQDLFDLNIFFDFDMDGHQALQAYPNDTYCMTEQDSISSTQWNSSSFNSSSTPPSSECDFSSTNSKVPTTSEIETLSQESLQNGKTQILILQSFKCQYCLELFSDKQRLESHIKRSHKHIRHPNICPDCSKRFTLPKDLKRHQQSVHQHKKLFMCKCGLDYSRKDHLLRHIDKVTNGSEDEKQIHHAVSVDHAR